MKSLSGWLSVMNKLMRPRTFVLLRVGMLTVPMIAILLLPGGAAANSGPGQAPATAELFHPPLGYRDGVSYAPRIHYVEDKLIENTDYGIMNPDLVGGTCFGMPWEQIYHAGEDLYREDGESTEGAEVTAVADGVVVYANPFMSYPGLVIIVEHAIPASGSSEAEGTKVYSVYAHIDDASLEVTEGDRVALGQRLGSVMYQRYTGRYPEHHPSGDDSHLHFEMRYFYDASRVYASYPACNGIVPGRGYTYPDHPDDFPTPGLGYTDPLSFIETRAGTPTPGAQTPGAASPNDCGTPGGG